jgi:hypothetical protein
MMEHKNFNNQETTQPLADINWLWLGHTDEYSELKKRIAHICRDVTNAGCIDEICINDIVVTFRQFGYEVVKK